MGTQGDRSAAQPSLKTRLLLGLLCGGIGMFIILSYFGVIPDSSVGRCRAIFCDPYQWQVLSFGMAFFSTGLALVIPPTWPRLGRLASLGVVGGLLAGLVGTFFFR